MKKILFFLFSCLSYSCLFGQNVIQVNNLSGANADYTSLQEAVDAATAGSLIYLYPSGTSYGNATISKRLAIIGPGYNIGTNTTGTTNVNLGNAIVGSINFNTESSNSFITGCQATYIGLDGVSNVVIKRNEFQSNSGDNIYVFNSANIKINGNYFNTTGDENIANTNSTGTEITNNVFVSSLGGNDFNIEGSDLTIRNNIFYARINVTNSLVKNNIFIYNSSISGNNQYSNNVFVYNYTSLASSNKINISYNSLFVGDPIRGGYSLDSRFQLKADAPAKGYGEGGSDAGIFGGSEPYRLSGLSTIPYIYEIQAPTSTSTVGGLNVTIKARSGN